MAGLGKSIRTVSGGWRLLWALFLLACSVGTSLAESRRVYDIDLRPQGVADALNGLSEQTGVPVVFPYDLVRDRRSNPVTGRYTVLEALDALLKDTGLSGGLSDKGVLMVSLAKPGSPKPEEALVTNQNNTQNTNKSAARPARILTLFASIAAAFSASAQDASEGGGSRDATKIDEVLVTAQKREERLQDVPVPIAVIDANALTSTNEVLLRDYYASVPGFSLVSGFGGNQFIAIRGVIAGQYDNPAVGVVIDDVPYGSSTGLGAGNLIPDVDPGDLARVEVLRGPQGTLYGVNSIGGLIKFVTVDPSLDGYSGRVQVGMSDVSHGPEPGYTLRASANVPLTDDLAVRISGFRRQNPGYIDNVETGVRGVNEEGAYGGRAAALWRPGDGFSVKLSALVQQDTFNGTSDADPTLGDLAQSYMRGTGETSKRVEAFSATVKAKLGAGIDLTSITGYNSNIENDSVDYSAYAGAATESVYGVKGAPFFSHAKLTKFSQELRFSGSIAQSIDWLAGGFYTHENAPGYLTISAADPTTGQVVAQGYYDAIPSSYREFSGFADVTYHVTDRFDVQLGGRRSEITSTNDVNVTIAPLYGSSTPAVTPEVSAKGSAFTYLFTPEFKLSPDLMTYARLASGYRAGGPNLNYGVAGEPLQFKPDKTQNYELGLKGDVLDHTVSVDVSVYYIDWKDIQLSLLTPLGFSYKANGSAAKSEGVEFSIQARPVDGLNIALWTAYDDAVLKQSLPSNDAAYGVAGSRLPFSSKWSGNLSIEQDFPLWNRLNGYIGGAYSYVGQREGAFQAGPERQNFPSYGKIDLHAGTKYESWTTNLFVTNLADKRGILDGGLGYLFPNSFIYIQPRTVGINVIKTF